MSSDLQNKLLQYEEAPSPHVWRKVSAALSESSFQDKLYHYQEAPPALVWKKISSTIHTNAKVVPITRSSVLKYISAAAVLVIIAGLSYFVIVNKESNVTSNTSVQNNTTPPPKIQVPVNEPNTAIPQEPVIASSASKEREPERKKTATVSKKILTILKPEAMTASISAPINFVGDSKSNISRVDLSRAEKMMVYTPNEGNAIRVSKKLFEVVHCKDGDTTCQHKVEGLQEKVSNASFSADFMGILDMVKRVQENQ